ncbi:MAG: Nre family DNA repair protein [Candidatus Nanoarchaeia archaeon]
MHLEKAAYLYKLTKALNLNSKSIELSKIDKKLEGSTPPGVFIGEYGYPKVFIGPMLTAVCDGCEIFDLPELWLQQKKSVQDIINFRLSLIRGKYQTNITKLNDKFVQKLQELALAKKSVASEAEFKSKPKGLSLNEEYLPFGPSAELSKFEIGNVHWQSDLQKVYYDKDLRAKDAVITLYSKGLLFSQIQKALSVGAMGLNKNRKLVPTKWSITAVDDILGKHLLEEVRQNPIIENYCVFEFSAFNNHFTVLLMPTSWQFENFEAFIRILNNEIMIYRDWEPWEGRKKYSEQAGGYYSTRFAIAEYLQKIGKQAGALIFREVYPHYMPLGVWTIRESIRNALKQNPKEFFDLKSALTYIGSKLYLPLSYYTSQSKLLKLNRQQTKLNIFFKI